MAASGLFEIRVARAADAVPAAELWLWSRRAALGIPLPTHSDADLRVWFKEVVVPSGHLWVATSGSSLTAIMELSENWIEQLYVAPPYFRQGYGSRLLELAQSSRWELFLWTFETNAVARAFYERHRFRQSGPASTPMCQDS